MSHSAMYTSLIQHLQALSPSHPHTLCCQHITHASVLPQLSIDCLPLLITRSLPVFSYCLTLLVSLLSYYWYFICHPYFLSVQFFRVISHICFSCPLTLFSFFFEYILYHHRHYIFVLPPSYSASLFIIHLLSVLSSPPPLSFFDFPLSFELLFFLDSQSFIISCPK